MSNKEDSFYFYDLETSGFSPREDRIMQFAGQRTDLDLQPIGDPHNILVKLSEDILPSPQAVLLTGITPQQTVSEGLTEAEFLKIFHEEIATPKTTFVGFNNIRFDDEFIRFTNYRNFHDPYEWHWSEGRSRWDVLDLVRMTRALRPKGLMWPFASDGRPSNRLEELSNINSLTHDKAHDALSDVIATIEVAKLIKNNQPKLFSHLYEYRQKQKVKQLVNSGLPFVYSSGKYSSEFLHTTVVSKLADSPNNQGALVFDLRYNPKDYIKLTPAKIISMWKHYCKERPCPHEKFPVKTMQYNRCPAVAPLATVTSSAAKNIDIDLNQLDKNLQALNDVVGELSENVLKAVKKMDEQQSEMFSNEQLSETALYDDFIGNDDKKTSAKLLSEDPSELNHYFNKFDDPRLRSLLPLYISKNYPKLQTDEIRERWEKFKQHKLLSGGKSSKAAKYFESLAITAQSHTDPGQQFILEELQLWGQSVLPIED